MKATKNLKKSLVKSIRQNFLLATFAVPVSNPDGWYSLKFDKIKANQVVHSAEGLTVNVDSSASPLIYKLPQMITVSKIKTTGVITGNLNLKTDDIQGEKKTDDFQFRLGLVLKGEKRLRSLQRLISPKWITTLFDLAPKDQGIDKIEFYNIASKSNGPKWKDRQHPLSDLLTENVIASQGEGVFDLSFDLPAERQVVAVWLSIDGDQTLSKYSVMIRTIDFNPETANTK
jgi:hypothetical protein